MGSLLSKLSCVSLYETKVSMQQQLSMEDNSKAATECCFLDGPNRFLILTIPVLFLVGTYIVSIMRYIYPKAILLLAFVAVFGAANGSSHPPRKSYSSNSDTVEKLGDSFRHGDLRALQTCQSAAIAVSNCLGSISTGQTCLECVFDIEDVLLEAFGLFSVPPCPTRRDVMCAAWNSLCPCSSCEDEFESWYLGCLQEPFCGAQSCEVGPCDSMLDEAYNCLASAPPSCLACITDAISGYLPVILSTPCTELETAICDTTESEVCSCSPCEQKLQDFFFCVTTDWCSGIGPCTTPSEEECTNLNDEAETCEMQFGDNSICVPCMTFIYSSIDSVDCAAKKDEFCQEIVSETNFCNCHEPCYNQVAQAVSCGTDCEGMTCSDPFLSQEECQEALATVNECFAQCVL